MELSIDCEVADATALMTGRDVVDDAGVVAEEDAAGAPEAAATAAAALATILWTLAMFE